MIMDRLHEPAPITDREAATLRESAIERESARASGLRQRIVVELALFTGARLGELADLRCGDVRLLGNASSIRVRGEDNPRVLPLAGPMADLLGEYFQWMKERDETCEPTDPLVRSQKGGALSPRGWQDAWSLAQRHAGLCDSGGAPLFSLDSARAFAGRAIYRLRLNPHDVQLWLGIDLKTNVERYRPEEFALTTMAVRDHLPRTTTDRVSFQTAASPDLLRISGLYDGTSGVIDRHEARRLLADIHDRDALTIMWVARCMDRGRAYFAPNHDLAMRKAQRVMPELDAMAEVGDAMAQYLLGSALEDGLGIPADAKRAINLYHRAAAQGYATAFNNLGLVHAYGRGTPGDQRKALGFFREGASLHEGSAMFNLAVMLGEGIGTEPKPAEALRWFMKAASIGEVRSMHNISYLYANGVGVPQSDYLAERWSYLAGVLPPSSDGHVKSGSDDWMIQLVS